MDWSESVYSRTFSDAMQSGKDAATRELERRAYLGSVVTYRRPAMIRWLTVDEAATQLGVSARQVRKICERGGIKGARRAGRGRGSPWEIPSRLIEGQYRIEVKPGKHGPKASYALSPAEEVPF